MGRFVGIDYGLSRVGIAVSDPLCIVAGPLRTVRRCDVLSFLDGYVCDEVVDCFVVGVPWGLDGGGGDMVDVVHGFMGLLRGRFPDKGVVGHDERFTSRLAFDSMLSVGMRRGRRCVKGNVDMISAAIMLNSFMVSNDKKCF